MSYSSTTYINPNSSRITSMAQFYPGATGEAMKLSLANPNLNVTARQTETDSSSSGYYSVFGLNGDFAQGYNNSSFFTNPFGNAYQREGADFSNFSGNVRASDYFNAGFNSNYGGTHTGGTISKGNYLVAGNGYFDAGGYNNSRGYFSSPFASGAGYSNSGYNFGNRTGVNYSNNYQNLGYYLNSPGFTAGGYNNYGNSMFSGHGFSGFNNYQNSGNYFLTPNRF